MESSTVPPPSPKTLSPERWVQAFIGGRIDLDDLPERAVSLRRPTRQWLARWRGLTREERLQLVRLIGAIGDMVDADQLLRVGEAIEDDLNVSADWRERILGAVDDAVDLIETRERERRRLASAAC